MTLVPEETLAAQAAALEDLKVDLLSGLSAIGGPGSLYVGPNDVVVFYVPDDMADDAAEKLRTRLADAFVQAGHKAPVTVALPHSVSLQVLAVASA